MSRKRKREKDVVPNTTSPNYKNSNKVKPKTRHQKELLTSINQNDLTFCIGPAGTGKTHLAVGAAVDFLQRNRVERIIISRPIVEAGQRKNNNKSVIGYLPGDINAKMSPFLRPIHDELNKFLNQETVQFMKNTGILEICPLEHMRGRTFERSFIILDEAQNAIEEQIEMCLTRLGTGSTMVLVGDIEQTDLPTQLEGGLENFIDDLEGLDGIGMVYLTAVDNQRHPLVKAILERRKQVLSLIDEPVSLEKVVKYDGQSTRNTPSDASVERQHDANTGDSLDGLIQENI